VPSADDAPALPPCWLRGSEGDTGRFPRSSQSRSTSEASSSTPAASPRLRRRSSPWPPGRLSHRGQKFPATAKRSRVRTAASPYPPDLSWWAVKGRQALISRVHLLVSLTGPASSGSADTSRRCQGCSHPHQRLLDQAALSFTQPLRRPGDEGLSPPSDFRRLVAHMVFCPVIAHENHEPPPLLKSPVDQPVSSPRTPGGNLMDQCSSGTTPHQRYRRPHQPAGARSSARNRHTLQAAEVLTGRRLGDQHPSIAAMTPSTARRSIPIRP
jgi:hypothetical protein